MTLSSVQIGMRAGGTISTHIREMGRAIGKEPPAQPDWEPDYEKPVSFVEAFKKPPGLRKEKTAL
ncbi:MAG: hypothetical protein V3U90_02145 [Dehalococcoidia bacterium]